MMIFLNFFDVDMFLQALMCRESGVIALKVKNVDFSKIFLLNPVLIIYRGI